MRQELAVLVETYLNSQNWKFGYNADRGLFTLNMSTKNFTGSRVVIQINDDSIIAYAIAPINVPEEKRQAACEFIARANYGLKVGTLEMDMNDGEIRNRAAEPGRRREVRGLLLPGAGPLWQGPAAHDLWQPDARSCRQFGGELNYRPTSISPRRARRAFYDA